MGGTTEDTAEAEAGVPTGIKAMKSVLTGAIVGSMMIGISTTRVGVGGTEAQVLAIGRGEAGAQVVEEREVLLGMEVKRGVLGLSSGIGKRSRLTLLKMPMQKSLITKVKTMRRVMHKMRISTMANILHNEMDMHTDISLELVCVLSLMIESVLPYRYNNSVSKQGHLSYKS